MVFKKATPSPSNVTILIIFNKGNQVNFLVYEQDSKKKKKGRSVGKIKITLFESWGRHFFKNNILHSKRRKKPAIHSLL